MSPCPLHHFLSTIERAFKLYVVEDEMTCMPSITLQPLVVNQVYIHQMEAMYVPFHMLYGGLSYYQRLQSDRPKCSMVLLEVSQTPKHI